jgi:murein DD-endopeptidase MepM/ murein hydrolase activator NlpD
VTLKVQESGAATVLLQVSLTSRSLPRDSVVAKLGWARTGRLLSVAWPASTKLAPGSYLLSVSGHDHHGQLLLGERNSPLALTLVVHPEAAKPAAPAPAPAVTPAKGAGGSAPSAEAPAAGVPSPAQSAAEGAVFPVAGTHNFGGPENAFGAPRDGYSHQGQDILTAEGTPVVAPYSGTIESTSYQEGGAGYYAVERTNVGFSFFFAHCMAGSLAVSGGQTVAAGAQLCEAGQTGDATAPHLDFEIWIDGWRTASGYPINPLAYLEAWEADGAVS